MQRFESSDDLDENVPNLLFFNIGFSFLVVAYFLKYIAVIGILHYQAVPKYKLIVKIKLTIGN